jgi:hypothetical protein
VSDCAGLERRLQEFFLQNVPNIVQAMNVFYFVGHFALTGVFFVWLYVRSHNGFRSFRNAFIVSTAIALMIHWRFPTAPPRLAGVGLEDTLAQLSNIDIGSPHSSSYSNPVAAIPSLHAGWAAAVGWGIGRYTSHWLSRILAMAYPVAVFLTIIVTGNHFVLDALAGVAVMIVGLGVTAAVETLRGGAGGSDGGILAAATRGGAVR